MNRRDWLSERLETGDRVSMDQTVTIRAYHATKKVRGKLTGQCSGGCGTYLTDEEKSVHQCQGPPKNPSPRQRRRPLTHREKQKIAQSIMDKEQLAARRAGASPGEIKRRVRARVAAFWKRMRTAGSTRTAGTLSGNRRPQQ